MSIFDNREKELIEQETEEALQRASDEYQKELDEAEAGKIYVNNIPNNCLDCPNIGCRRGCKAYSDDIKKEFTTKRPKNCPLHNTAEIKEKTLDSVIEVIKVFLADNGFTVEEFSDLFADIKEIGNDATNKN